QQVRERLGLGEVADGADGDVVAAVQDPEEVPADASESVDADARHPEVSTTRLGRPKEAFAGSALIRAGGERMRFGRTRLIPALVLASATAGAADKPRARALGVPFDGTPGPLDAITDVAGVTVGHVTLIEGEGKLVVGKGPVRTGVTAILPRGRASLDDPVFAGWFALNG